MKRTFSSIWGLLLVLLGWQAAQAQVPQTHPQQGGVGGGNPRATLRISAHDDHPISCLGLQWNANTMAWDTASRDSMTYLPDGKLATEKSFFFNAGQFYPAERRVYGYDPQGRPKSKLTLAWSGADWDSSALELWSYDAFGSDADHILLDWAGSAWDTIGGQRWSNAYNGSNQLIERQTEEYNNSNNSWRVTGLERYHRNGLGEWDSLTYFYDNVGNWEPYIRYVDVAWYDYAQLRFAEFKLQEYDGGVWEDQSKGYFTYGPTGSRVARYLQFTSAWDSAYRDMEDYDAEGHRIHWESASWNNGWVQTDGANMHYTYDGQMRTVEYWDELWNQGSYLRHEKMVYGSFFAVGVPVAAEVKPIQSWPNPVQNVWHLSLPNASGPATVNLYDLQGRLRQTWLLKPGSQQNDLILDPQLPSGDMIYSIITKSGAFRGKIMLAR